MEENKTQNGNALWFILIAIVLLGLLTSFLTRSGGSTNETGDYEQLTIQANEILQYVSSIENGVQSLLARGCSENELSFEANNNSGYTNPNSPTDNSCHIFEPEGAGLTYESFPKTTSYNFEFSMANNIVGIGTDISSWGAANPWNTNRENELIIYLQSPDEGVCNNMNKTFFGDSAIPVDPSNLIIPPETNRFNGTGANGNQLGNNSGWPATGCFYGPVGSGYDDVIFFYHVLLAR
ncbi:MAG: hypothetical protein AAF988_04695 [Pseudomonadota bacterium]